jgi:hypothetical protein
MEGMYPLLGMVGMRPLVGMELGRRGMIIGDKRQAVRPPSSGGRLSAKEVVGTARRQFIISSRYHHASIHSKVESRGRDSIADRSKQRRYWIQQPWTHNETHAGCIPLFPSYDCIPSRRYQTVKRPIPLYPSGPSPSWSTFPSPQISISKWRWEIPKSPPRYRSCQRWSFVSCVHIPG